MIARPRNPASRRIFLSGASPILLLLAGCRGAPLFNVLGSFFPAWMVCLAAGIVLTLLSRWAFLRTGFERYLRPLVVVYPALATFFTCAIWLLLFQ